MKPLEKLVNTIRIAPHGIIPSIVGVGLLIDAVFKLGLYNNLPRLSRSMTLLLECAYVGTTTNCLLFGPLHGIYGFKKYKRFKSFIKKHGIDRRHVEPNIRWYCERQAYKAAAYACGLGDEFNSINKNYPKNKKFFRWVPEI